MSVTVSGIMINPVGEPVVNAQITLTAVANSLTVLNTFSVTVRTDNTGAYRIQLEEGSYSITVAANGRSFVYGAVTLDDTTGPSTLNQLLKQQIMESELTPDVILYFRQIQQQVANDLATIKVLESSATDATESAAHYRDEAKQYAADLDTALAVAQGYRDESGVSAAAAAKSAIHAFESESVVIANANAAALSEANTLQYRNEAQSAAEQQTVSVPLPPLNQRFMRLKVRVLLLLTPMLRLCLKPILCSIEMRPSQQQTKHQHSQLNRPPLKLSWQ
ncbi:prophage tail fiber N-terminal domain-containing protein [Yersinia enterocolitica]|uniref:prophage tail fiber N-terminal domain-containing protein n=1 Tax=Yersinia enterocolitica TaxID=630 RepID=UPI001EFE5E56|nr:prophage tail fiber N-terminal domain-containing protein [Yersinia enterocolitica]